MSKTRIFALFFIVLILAAFFTNPSQEKQEEAVKRKAIALLKQHAGEKNKGMVNFGIQFFGDKLVDQFMKEHIKVDNYYLFSLTKVRWEGKDTVIGGGAFQTVWISPKIDEKAAEIVDIIKQGI